MMIGLQISYWKESQAMGVYLDECIGTHEVLFELENVWFETS